MVNENFGPLCNSHGRSDNKVHTYLFIIIIYLFISRALRYNNPMLIGLVVVRWRPTVTQEAPHRRHLLVKERSAANGTLKTSNGTTLPPAGQCRGYSGKN